MVTQVCFSCSAIHHVVAWSPLITKIPPHTLNNWTNKAKNHRICINVCVASNILHLSSNLTVCGSNLCRYPIQMPLVRPVSGVHHHVILHRWSFKLLVISVSGFLRNTIANTTNRPTWDFEGVFWATFLDPFEPPCWIAKSTWMLSKDQRRKELRASMDSLLIQSTEVL